jgi:PAS domain S-box-containing protein
VAYPIAIPLVVVPLLVLLGQVDFLLFHVAVELFASVIGILLFFVAAVGLRLAADSFLYYLGAGYFWIALIDLLHAAVYRGMGLVAGDSANPATQYWVLARLLEALILLTAPAFLHKKVDARLIFAGFAAVAAVVVVAVQGGWLPDAYDDDVGQTAVKVGVEYLIVALLGVAWLRYRRRRAVLPRELYGTLSAVLALTAVAELAFTVYVDVYGEANMAGHIFKLLSYWLLFLIAGRLVLTLPLEALSRGAGTLDALDDPVMLVARSGEVVHLNPAARRAFGLAAEEMPGSLHSFGPLRNLAERDCPICRTIRDGRKLADFQIRDKHTGFWYGVAVTAADLGQAGGTSVVRFRDITTTKRLERQVREEKLRADMALDNTGLGIWDWDMVAGTMAFSHRVQTMLGYAGDEWEATPMAWSSRVHPDDWPAVEVALQDHLRNRTDLFSVNHRLRCKDGGYAWIHTVGRVVERDAEGKPLRAVGTHADITATMEMELSLQRSNEDLEQFAYAVSHDLQEPLRMVGGFLGVLRRRYREALPAEAQEFIDRAVDGAERMTAMIRDLLEVSRVQTKGADFAAASLSKPLAAALDNLTASIAESGARIDIPAALPVVWGDQTQITRLFQNLIGNAIKYGRPGKPPHVVVSASPARDMIVVTVADDGIGIPEADRGRAFQPFQRLHGADTPGTGIGLTLCRRIVERHGGTIAIEEGPEGGALLRFTLPAVPSAHARAEERPRTASAPPAA